VTAHLATLAGKWHVQGRPAGVATAVGIYVKLPPGLTEWLSWADALASLGVDNYEQRLPASWLLEIAGGANAI
jgi:hypothetical protein